MTAKKKISRPRRRKLEVGVGVSSQKCDGEIAAFSDSMVSVLWHDEGTGTQEFQRDDFEMMLKNKSLKLIAAPVSHDLDIDTVVKRIQAMSLQNPKAQTLSRILRIPIAKAEEALAVMSMTRDRSS